MKDETQLDYAESNSVYRLWDGQRWPEACKFIKKEILAQAFSCEFCEISKNTFSQNTPGRLTLDCTIIAKMVTSKRG